MLTPEELRIGNYIIGKQVDGHQDIVEKILGLTKTGIATSPFRMDGHCLVQEVDTKLTLPYGWADGLPIHEEWLLAFGFSVYVRDYGQYSRDGLVAQLQAGVCVLFRGQVVVSRPLKFVHQLQNAFYELIGVMLEKRER